LLFSKSYHFMFQDFGEGEGAWPLPAPVSSTVYYKTI
jgi:hypothetical protein